jgi:CheY-like chemotaxis protein
VYADTVSRTVLIVDDNADLAENLGEVLELDGIDAVVETDPHRALDRARGMPLELALLDVRMPGLSGPALHERLRAIHPNSRFVLMSAYARPEEVEDSLRAGASLMAKPIDLADLRAMLGNVARDTPGADQD